jgi:hypothetical protein
MAESIVIRSGTLNFTKIAQDLASSSTKRRIAELHTLQKQLKTEGWSLLLPYSFHD